MQLKRVAEAKLPTPWGDFLMVGFEELATGQDHVALVYGDISAFLTVIEQDPAPLFSDVRQRRFQLKTAITTQTKKGIARQTF